jgi:glycosyltransferase involved in cell wall biosynthesis
VVGRLDVDPVYVRSIERQVKDAGLEQQVAFLGSLPDGEVASLLEESHVLAVPSSHEGYGIVYVEAMGFGLPVIAGSHGGAIEIVDHGINGLLVSPGDVKGIAEHIRDLVKDRGTLAAMGRAALERFEAFPTWEDTGRTVYEFIHQFG